MDQGSEVGSFGGAGGQGPNLVRVIPEASGYGPPRAALPVFGRSKVCRKDLWLSPFVVNSGIKGA